MGGWVFVSNDPHHLDNSEAITVRNYASNYVINMTTP